MPRLMVRTVLALTLFSLQLYSGQLHSGIAWAQPEEESQRAAEGKAKEDDRGQPAKAPDGAIVDQIVVEAQLRPQDLQEIPFSITAFSDIQVEEAGIETPEDLLGLAPNITLGNSFTVGNSFITVRGITQINNSDPPMAIVVDGVYQANQKQFNQELFDIERIEILRGPQGSLYGRNSLGGAINIITRPASPTFGGFGQLGFGNGSALRASGLVGGALDANDKVLARLSASYRDSEGLVENVFLQEKADFFEDTTGRARIEFHPLENLMIDLRGQASRTDGGAVYYSLVPTDTGANDFHIRPQENILGFSEREIDDYSLKLDWTGTNVVLTSISAYTDLQETYRSDLDFTSLPIVGQGQDLDVSFFSQEIRLTSMDEGPVRWHAGAYYLKTDRELLTTPYFDTDGTIDGFVPIFFIGEDNQNKAYALFGHADVPINEKWSVVAGLRYDNDERNQTDIINGGDRTRSFSELQPRLTLQYAARPELMGYLTLGRGFRSGGYNAPPVNPDFFDQEVTDNVELGFKSTLSDGSVRLNGAVYKTYVNDFQFFLVDIATASQIISNINEAEMTGLELDVWARLGSGFDVMAALGLNDSSIEDFDGTGRFVGNQTPNNITWTGNLALQYNTPISNAWVLSLRGDLDMRGKQYWHADNQDVTDGRNFFHARVGLDGQKWSLSLWGKNLLDEAFWAEYFDATWAGIPSGMDVAWPGRPRTLGIDVRRKF